MFVSRFHEAENNRIRSTFTGHGPVGSPEADTIATGGTKVGSVYRPAPGYVFIDKECCVDERLG